MSKLQAWAPRLDFISAGPAGESRRYPISSSVVRLDACAMRYWFTPFSLSATAYSALNEAGLHPWPEGQLALSFADSLLLYDSPDRLVAAIEAGPEAEDLTALNLLQGYRHLLTWSQQTGQPLLAISQLHGLGAQGLRSWLAGGAIASQSHGPTLPIPPLLASVTLSLLEAEPALLDCYYDLELRASLLGRDPDMRYLERLQHAAQDADALLHAFLTGQLGLVAAQHLEKRLDSKDTELKDVRDAAELSLLQLDHQVQAEREQYLLADGEKQRQLEERDRDLEELRRSQAAQGSAHVLELQELRERMETRLAELEHCLASRDTELKEARDAAELALLQLHQQVQAEREQYLLAGGEKQRQLEERDRDLEELRRSQAAQGSAHVLELQELRERMETRLAELEHCLASRDTELKEAREAAELSLRQLHQVQDDLEHYFLADAEKQRQLEAGDRELGELRRTKASQESAHELELQALRERMEPRLAELEHCLTSRETELKEAREASELSLLQLNQVQEELEHYFLNARASDQLAQAQFEQLQRALRLMLRLQPDLLPTAPYPPSLAVQVLPELAAATPNPTLQAEALLNTYAASLQRASALLERARRP